MIQAVTRVFQTTVLCRLFSLSLSFVSLTCSLHLKVVWQQFILPVAEGEGQKRQQEGIQNADDGQDVGPTHGAIAQAVLVRPLAAHPLHLGSVPAIRVDHAAQNQTRACSQKQTERER